MRNAVEFRRFVPCAAPEKKSERDRAHIGHFVCENRQAVFKSGGLYDFFHRNKAILQSITAKVVIQLTGAQATRLHKLRSNLKNA